MFANAPKMLHQPIEFIERWPAIALDALSNESELFQDVTASSKSCRTRG